MARVGDHVFGKQNCLPVGLPKPEFTDVIVAVSVSLRQSALDLAPAVQAAKRLLRRGLNENIRAAIEEESREAFALRNMYGGLRMPARE